MKEQGIIIEPLGGAAAARAEDAFRRVYASAFAEPPYDETPGDVAAAFRRFRVQTRKPAFRGALARTEAGDPVGMAYGYPLSARTRWWDQLLVPVPEETRHEDGRRTFGLMELAVRAPWRGHGIARRLHDVVLEGTGVERLLLNVLPEAESAQAAYRSWGYRKVGETRPWDGAALHDVMVLDLVTG
ncbi:GNAT family N-acetyltransferase [Streptomyces klenkii]|uniref:GNAT family N-acetyltransferase n=1 Tax=Streptomyces klenkii TaxID=1420899 RepID=UPI0036F127E2